LKGFILKTEYATQTLDKRPTVPQVQQNGVFQKLLNKLIPQDVLTQNNPALDGLRAMAALMVLVFHLIKNVTIQSNLDPNITGNFSIFLQQASNYWEIGARGVELFFVISAFLLFQGYSRALFITEKKMPRLGQFLKRRFLRIYPAFLVSVVVMVLLFAPQLLNPDSLYILIAHVFLIFDFNLFVTSAINQANWSLAVETKFYILVPILAFIMAFLVKKANIKVLVGFVGIFLLIPFFQIFDSPNSSNIAIIDNSIFKIFEYLPVFFAGLAVCLFYTYINIRGITAKNKEKFKSFFNLFGILSILSLLAIPTLVAAGVINGDFYRFVQEQFLGICFSGILMAVLFGTRPWASFFSYPLLRFIGIISYSLYLWHENLYKYIIIPIARSFKREALVYPIAILLTLVIIFPVAYLSYMFVERPFFKVKKSGETPLTPTESPIIGAERGERKL
jgi:peptidoglycan/LPS O-acetylase OafA/YrhL